MTDVSVGFITPSGMSISATAPTAAEALQQLVDIFGEDVAAAYEQALSEVEGIIADADPRGIAPGVPAPQPAGGNNPGTGGPGASGAPGPGVVGDVASGSEDAAPPVALTQDLGSAAEGGREVAAQATVPSHSAEVVSDHDGSPSAARTGQPCSVCGGAVPEGLAALSVEQFGDVRCRQCGTW